MSNHTARSGAPLGAGSRRADEAQRTPNAAPTTAQVAEPTLAPDEMPCPICGAPMPDLKGGKATICPKCGFKDSCCY